ncbi:uncharacterized protein BJX67DRAFT_380641 [Aspergillus lucknowensis]|uniref:Uncharacterized protein n=1 Tax=Aspergillus lucknowensis TaxID=176173 RepID=A0ABR4LT15_9EURO
MGPAVVPASHTRSMSQPIAQYPAVPHPPLTTRFMHSTHPPQQLYGPPLREPPRPQRPRHIQSSQSQFHTPPALTLGPFQHLPPPGPAQIAHPQHLPQIAPAKPKKEKKTPKILKKEQKQMTLYPQGGLLARSAEDIKERSEAAGTTTTSQATTVRTTQAVKERTKAAAKANSGTPTNSALQAT